MGGGHEKKAGGRSFVDGTFGVIGKSGSQPQPGDERKVGGSGLVHDALGVIGTSGASTAPVRSDGEAVLPARATAPVRRSGGGPADAPSVQQAAAQGMSGAGGPLPHLATIQQLFGRHDVSGVQAHVGGAAATANRAISAEAYAIGNQVAFAGAPSLHTAAHEAAHVVQQRGGVQLKGGVGEVGDRYELHADAVADRVVRGESAEGLLDQHSSTSGSGRGGVQRQAVPADIVDAGVAPLPGGVPPDPLSAEPGAMQDDELGQAYARALTAGDSSRVQALDDEMDRRSGGGTALPRGPQPVTGGAGAVSKDVALSLLDNMSEGKPPFKPAEGIGGCSWFTTEGNPYTSVSTDKSINVRVEIAKGSAPLVFHEVDLVKLFDELTDPTRAQAEAEYRAKFKIPEGAPLSKTALKAINRTLDRFVEKQMWKRIGEKVAASSQKVGEIVLEENGRFSKTAGKFAVVADPNKISLKGGTAPVVDALAREGVTAEPVVVEAAEALATKMKWAGRVRAVFRYGGRVLIVVGVTADLIKIYRAQDRLKATLTSAGGWAGATAAGAAFATYWAPADVAGPWAWVGHGVGTLVAGGIGYWFGSTITRNIYELIVE
ncbi:MAG: DUF4157 domain-containing protein [Myxococcales bacterium]|nr:DUF4157 domain-containing protein [Myxococcales bacterium]